MLLLVGSDNAYHIYLFALIFLKNSSEHKFILKMESGNQQSLYYDPWSQQQQQPFMNMPMNNLTTDSVS